MRFGAPLIALVAGVSVLCTSFAATPPSPYTRVAISGEAATGGNLTGGIGFNYLANSGLAVITDGGASPTRLFYRSGSALKLVAGVSYVMPGGGTISRLSSIAANEFGQIAFQADTSMGRNVYVALERSFAAIAVIEGVTRDGEHFYSIGRPGINDRGDVAFAALTYSDAANSSGVYLSLRQGSAYQLARIARRGGPAPGGGQFTVFSEQVLAGGTTNGPASVAFAAGNGDGTGVYLWNGSTTLAVARVNVRSFAMSRGCQVVAHSGFTNETIQSIGPAPGVSLETGSSAPGGETFRSFNAPAVNDAGTVAFYARTQTQSGIYAATPAGVTVIAREGDLFEGARLTSFQAPQISNAGVVVFACDLVEGSTRRRAILMGDGTDLVKVVAAGEPVLQHVLATSSFSDGPYLASHAVTARGQVLFEADLNDGRTAGFVYTPPSRMRATSDGVWETRANWLLGIVPFSKSNVILQSEDDAVFHGPKASTAVNSVFLGGAGGVNELKLYPTATLTAALTTVEAGGVLSGAGSLTGSLVLTSGATINLGLGGTARPLAEYVRVNGRVTMAGALNVSLLKDFKPLRDQSFDLLDFTSRTATFGAVELPELDPVGLTWDVSKLYSTGKVSVSAATFFSGREGVYTGLVAAETAGASSSGSLVLDLEMNGTFKATISYAGTVVKKSGVLDLNGAATITFGSPAKQLVLQLDMSGETAQVTGSVIENGASVARAVLDRSATAFSAQSPLVGRYTVALPPDPSLSDSAYPQGIGYGTLSVSKQGLAKLVGVLGDGTAFSAGGPLSASGEFPFYVSLLRGKGFLLGRLALRGSSVNDAVGGSLEWYKPATTSSVYPSELRATLAPTGSGYQVIAGFPLLEFSDGKAMFTVNAGGLAPVAPKPVTVDAKNKVTADSGEKLSMSFPSSRYGITTGSFRDADGKSRSFTGVILQQQDRALGLFKNGLQVGNFELK